VEGIGVLDDLKEEGIVNKVGGRFKLSTLIQKRIVMLNAGARPLVESKTSDRMAIVLQEILQDKIFLDSTGSVQVSSPEDHEIPPSMEGGVPDED
jgi:DNA-directed RNA polymerase subunit omega